MNEGTPNQDEITYDEGYCDYCENEGHTFSTCPVRDDAE